jgi:protein subunit release factor A
MIQLIVGGIIMVKILEIRAAEGGDDSKLFVSDLAEAYIKLANRFG